MRGLYTAMLRSYAVERSRERSLLGVCVPALVNLRRKDVIISSWPSMAVLDLAGQTDAVLPKPRRTSPGTLAGQLGMANGLALASKQERQRTLVTVLAQDTGARDHECWQEALTMAGRQKLPVIFFLLTSSDKAQLLLAHANAHDVASMIVDGYDAVAVFRICQEAQMRARIGDGPAFVVCYSQARRADPLRDLRRYLEQHHYPVGEWRAKAPKNRRPKRSKTAPLPFQIVTVKRSYR